MRCRRLRCCGQRPAWALATIALFSTLAPLAAQNNFGHYRLGANNEVTLRVSGVFEELPPSGHYPIRVKVDNRSAKPFTAQFSFVSSNGTYNNDTKVSSRFEIRVDPTSDAEHSMIVPLALQGGTRGRHYGGHSSLGVNISHSHGPGRLSNGVSGGMDLDYPAVGFGTEAAKDVRGHIQGSLTRSSKISSSGGSFGSNFDPADLPADWLAFSGLDLVILTEADWARVAEGSRNALLDWVRFGGRLVIYPEAADRSLSGLGIKAAPGAAGSDADVLPIGLGTVRLADSLPVGGGTVDTATPRSAMSTSATRVERYAFDYTGLWGAGRKLGKRRFATAQVVLILLLFGILVGPVNLFVWAKPGKRHRLFFTTPIISVGASLLLTGLIVVQDGFGGKGIRHTAIFADPDSNKAYILQEQASRTGVLFGTSFEPGSRSLTVQLGWGGQANASGRGSSRRGNPRSFSVSGGRLSGDWFSSRSDQAHYLETAVPSRGGIELSGGSDGGAPKLTSTFDFALGRLFYIDGDGKPWSCAGLDTGASATLVAAGDREFERWWKTGTDEFTDSVSKLLQNAAQATPRGHYFAVAGDAGGLVVDTLKSVRWRDGHTLICGRAVTK